MADFISRETAIDYIKRQQCKKCSDIGLCGNCAVLVAIRLLETAPAADVEPVRHGRWIVPPPPDAYTYCKVVCSECHKVAGKHKTVYCPNCGAKMELEDNHEN